ncbi:glycosyltransferase family 4 protein [Leptolyngbya ohadii]|uniref:glycosyltransferase family 4 protein n=1 Tax=Leptolyngbya ohadii TaxID=1962290 RepID=UPI000B599CD7|nr:glycosyltransferase family 4 protein [Leptolyngbya ohadii]
MSFPSRVIIYTDSAGIGGAEISLSHLVRTASPEIHLTVVGVDEKVINFIAASRSGIDCYILPAAGIRSFLKHRSTFQQCRPEIIHCNLCTPWAGAIGLAAALSLPNVRVVRVDQLPLRTTDALTLWQTRALCLRMDAHVAVGQASATRMEDFYALGRNSVISIPNGVPDPGEPELPPHQDTTELTVGSIGRLDAMKAHDVLLRAAAQVPGVRIVILGEGDGRSNLEKLANELGIRDRVEMPGWVDCPPSYLPQFDVVAMPSRSEGFPLAMVEAMLAARPVIATRVGSMPEAIHDETTGLLIDKNDVDGLARSLKRLRDDPTLRLQLGKQAREMALAHFTVETMTRRYEALWAELLDRPQAPRLRVPRPKD